MERYRTEKRKANLGERILITRSASDCYWYANKIGNEYIVEGTDVVASGGYGVSVNRGYCIDNSDYEVIVNESKEEENEMTTKSLTDYSYEELLEAIKTKAQVEISMKDRLIAAGILAKELGCDISEAIGNVGKLAVRTSQAQRDQIVEQAKRDVAELIKHGSSSATVKHVGNETYRRKYYVVEFAINNEKRTVAALIKRADVGGRIVTPVVHRGIAKCDPSDCFNAHIGKAIALRRALGLEVPSEYLTIDWSE